jgi:Tfp pilus assembly protein PilV
MKSNDRKKSKGLSLLEVVVASSVLFTGASASMGLFALGCRIPEKAEEAAVITQVCQTKLDQVLAKMDEDLRPIPPSFDLDRTINPNNYVHGMQAITENPDYQFQVKGQAGTGELTGMAVMTVDVKSKDGRTFSLTGCRRSSNRAPMKAPPPPPPDFRGGSPSDINELKRGAQLVKEAGCLDCHNGSSSPPWTWSYIQTLAKDPDAPPPALPNTTNRWYKTEPPMDPEAFLIRVITTDTGPGGSSMGVQINNPADARAVAAYVAAIAQGQNLDLFLRTSNPPPPPFRLP